jgi:hypothetical protein
MRRPYNPRPAFVRVERLEGRSVPAFLAAPAYPAGPNGGDRSSPVAVVTGDFNHDGHLDVATANFRAGGISILLGTGTGRFKPAGNITLPLPPVNIIAADVNGDGKLDLITANRGIFNVDGSVSVLLGNGLGGFTLSKTIPVGKGPYEVAAADLNGDGKLDLAVANFGSNPNPGNTITLLMGTGTGAFTSGGTVTVGSQPASVAIGDFNGDGKPDLASVSGNRLMINLGNGDGTFLPGNVYPTAGQSGKIVVGDFNHDGKLDVAIGSGSPSAISVLLGNGDGTFGAFTNYPENGNGVADLVLADMNGDGNLDLVTANGQTANNVGVLLGNPDGSFGPAALYSANGDPQGIAVGDFNGDGRPDVATAGIDTAVGATTDTGTVAVLLGNGDGTLAASRQLPIGIDPTATVVADFTGDGKPDLAVAFNDVQFSGAAIFPNLGGGAFGDGLRTAAVKGPTGLATADFNGDGKPDLAVGTATGVSILLGNGDAGGTFTAPQTYLTGLTTNTQVRWVAVGDFNNDHKPDVVLATDSGVSVFLGNGDGTFQPAINTAGEPASNLAVGDFNGDGKLDLAVISNPKDHLDILFGNGDGTFGTATKYTTDHAPSAVAVGDFNGDGKPDLAVTTLTGFGPGLMIFQNGTGGRFFPKGTYATGGGPTGVIVADFNGDHKLDIATVDQGAGNVCVFPGTGLGTFGTPSVYEVGNRAMWGAAADFNGDGKPDLAVSNFNSGTVSVLVSPNPVAGFRVTPAGPVTAGKPVGVTVEAMDAAGHLVPSFTGSVKLTSTDAKAVLGLPFTFTATAFGTHRFAVTPKTAGSQGVSAHSGSLTGTGTVTVNAAKATHLKVIAPTTETAGLPFDLTVVAADPFGNPDPTFTGTVHFTSTDLKTGVAVPADYTFTAADGGSHTFTGGATLITAGARTITATTGKWKGTAKVNVAAGAVSKFLISGFPPLIGAGVAHAFTVTAVDAFGNVVTNYVGTVQFTSSDGSATLPVQYTFTALNKGKHSFTAKLMTAGTQSLAVTDVSDSSVTGSETGITVA